MVEVQQTGHVNLSFIVFNFRQKHHDQTAKTDVSVSAYRATGFILTPVCHGSKWKKFQMKNSDSFLISSQWIYHEDYEI